MTSRNWAGTAKPLSVAAALLVILGGILLAAVAYTPESLGLGDETSFIVVLGLRGLGFLLLLAAAALLVRTRKTE